MFEIFINFRHIIDKIPVVEDQEDPEPRDSSISKIMNSLAPKIIVNIRRTIVLSSWEVRDNLISELQLGLE